MSKYTGPCITGQQIRDALKATNYTFRSPRGDDLTRFVALELEQTLAQVFLAEYQPLMGAELVPFDNSLAPYAESWARNWFHDVGRAKVSSTMDSAPARVDFIKTKDVLPTAIIAASFGWNVIEMERAVANGIPLDQTKQRVAVDAINREIDNLILMGNADLNYTGLLNAAAVTEAAAPPVGAWAGLTAQQLVQSLLTIELNTYNGSLGRRPPTTMAVAPTGFARLHAPYSANDGDTILQRFLSSSIWVKDVRQIYEAETAGVGGTPSVTCYQRDPGSVNFKVGTLTRLLPPQAQGFEFVVNAYAVVGGIEFARPATALRYRGV